MRPNVAPLLLAVVVAATVAGCSSGKTQAARPSATTARQAGAAAAAVTTTIVVGPSETAPVTAPPTSSPEPRPIATGADARPTGSGIDGRVRAGDGTPLASPVDILDKGSQAKAAAAVSGGDGHFLVPLTPGSYVVRATPGGGKTCAAVSVDVIVGVFAPADVACG